MERKEDRKAVNHCELTCRATRRRCCALKNLLLIAFSPPCLKIKTSPLPFAPSFIIHCGLVFKCINTLRGACVNKKQIPGNFVTVLYLGEKKEKVNCGHLPFLRQSQRKPELCKHFNCNFPLN